MLAAENVLGFWRISSSEVGRCVQHKAGLFLGLLALPSRLAEERPLLWQTCKVGHRSICWGKVPDRRKGERHQEHVPYRPKHRLQSSYTLAIGFCSSENIGMRGVGMCSAVMGCSPHPSAQRFIHPRFSTAIPVQASRASRSLSWTRLVLHV